MIRRLAAWPLVVIGPLDGSASAAPITRLLCVPLGGTTINHVDFDSTQFLGGGVQLTAISPNWESMSYGPTGGYMFYTNGLGTLNRVRFDGMQFIGGGVQLEAIVPDWDAMSLIFAALTPVSVPEPASTLLLAAGFLGLLGTAMLRRLPGVPAQA